MHYNNILFFGTGGGNDIFSTTLAILALRESGVITFDQCSIAGVISPFHQYVGIDFMDKAAESVGILKPDAKRLLLRRGDEREISFVDAAVARMVELEQDLDIDAAYALTLGKGSSGLAWQLQYLSTLKGFDLIVLVDIGGDIFYPGQQEPHVLSPMFDAMALRAALECTVPTLLFEAGPGTDGEMTAEGLSRALSGARAQGQLLPANAIDEWEKLYRTYIEPVRTGNTVPRTIEAYRSSESFLELTYRARAHIGDRRWYEEFVHRISTMMCRMFYLVDPSKIVNPFAVGCDSVWDWFTKTQARYPTNCEANLEYWHSARGLAQFLTPSPLFNEEQRLDMFQTGLKDLAAGVTDLAWVWDTDWAQFSRSVPPGLKRGEWIEPGLYSITRE